VSNTGEILFDDLRKRELITILIVIVDLAADLASWVLVGVNVGVDLTRPYGPHHLVKLSRSDALCIRAQDVGSSNGPAKRSRRRGACWLPAPSTQERNDASVDILLAQVNVGGERRHPLEGLVAQLEFDCRSTDLCFEFTLSRA
jgi:hypothetical protein